LERAAGLRPGFGPSWNALGVVRDGLGDAAGARDAFQRAIDTQPDYPEALSNLGLAMYHTGEGDRALPLIDRALALKPDFTEAAFNRGVVLHASGNFDAARMAWQATLALDPRHREARSNLLMALHYNADMTGEALLDQARTWSTYHGWPADRFDDWPNSRDATRRLRIGYVSPDFRDHSCAHFLLPLFGAHDRTAVEVFAYAELARPDAMSERLRHAADHWRPIRGRNDLAAAKIVRDDAIDILIDLAGHTADNRLGIFALKPTPVQATWLGYPGTAGLETIDYRITDQLADPSGSEAHASEALIRLPHGFHCYSPPAELPVSPPPAGTAGHVTFGSFNNLQKVTPPVISAWASILAAAPGARLVLKSSWLGRASVAARLRATFVERGIDPERLDLIGWVDDPASHLGAYSRIDIALDPFPYNGTTTTLEALWMGVPVVSLAGKRHAGRVGVSLLTHAGTPELVADAADTYVEKAVAIAADAARLAEYRRTLRERLAASPLLDPVGFARDLEAVYRTMWQRWCAGGAG
ncbi:MAG: tetratricopeptide repeat protein, partial [Rhodospirillales bacterium]|nr:tetratricopeptide repeat protein [Rhodospirillales bacterium]